jgi:phytoene dehydrogenase-like protein
MTPGQLFAFRPVPGYARYRTPIRGLYLCGAAAHPGGGVMGTPGLNAARAILGRRRLRSRRRAKQEDHETTAEAEDPRRPSSG